MEFKSKFALMGGVSALVLSSLFFTAGAYAQAIESTETTESTATESTESTATEGTSLETVVVTGRRAAMATAVDIKQSADQIVDAVVADDVGKLPDASVTEVLQRVSGVSITHFDAASDPDHYSVEGSGVAIRGMTQVSSTLNGRSSFSANGGSGLLWEDVPPELMASVNVYKSSTADQLEGGVGGTVDLRTHMPFDFDGFTFRATAGGSYGDFIKQAHPKGSFMISNRWSTPIGEIGLLIDAAYSDISYRNDTMQIEPYFPHVGVNVSGSTTETRDDTVYIPGGFDYRTSNMRRKRAGFYEALQWKPVENLSLYQTAFISYYNNTNSAYAMLDSAGESMTLGTDTSSWSGANYILDDSNSLVYADNLVNSYYQYYTPTGMTCVTESGEASSTGGDCSIGTYDTEYSVTNNRTMDLTEGFHWLPNDDWRVTGAFQYVHSTSNSDSLAVYGTAMLSAIGMDLRHVYPEVTVPNESSRLDYSYYNWAATMDHHARNSGQQFAVNVDAEWTPHNGTILKAIKFGMRADSRKENDRSTGYTYTSLSPWYAGYSDDGTTMHYFDEDESDVDTVSLHNYFRGKISSPGAALFPSLSKVKKINTAYWHNKYSYLDAGDDTGNEAFDPRDNNQGISQSVDAYAMAKFASADAFFGYPVTGNVGVRLVYNHHFSSGYIKQSEAEDLEWSEDGEQFDIPEAYTYREGGRDTWTALPSFNMDVMPTDRIHVRLALSETMGNLSFSNMQAGGSMSINTDNNVITGFTASTGTPDLKPQLSRNLDLSLEWYGDNGDAAHIAGFWKSIKDYITYGVSTEDMTFNMGDYGDETEKATVTNYMNSDKETVIRGFEAGFTKFMDFLPAPFDGFGINANFTYIDSYAPGDASYNMNGQLITGLPVEMISRYNYNLTGMYEKGPYSFRVAWTWRSKYLLTPTGNGTDGTYDADTTGTTCNANDSSAGGTGLNSVDGTCAYNLPIFSDSFGQLDAGMQYKINDNLSLSISGQNLMNAVTKTLMGYGAQQHYRSWFIADRRINFSVSYTF